LQHYLRGVIESPNYYFTNVNYRKKYDLDLLCLTQGWSAYSYEKLLNTKPKTFYDFENGINSTVRINKYNSGNFIVHKLKNSKPFYVNLAKEDFDLEPFFKIKNLFPLEDEAISISETTKDGSINKALVFTSFKPSSVPNHSIRAYKLEKKQGLNTVDTPIFFQEIEKLDEVVIKTKKKQERYDKLKKNSNGTIDIFDDVQRNSNIDFATYISSKGFRVSQPTDRQSGEPLLTIVNTRRTTLGGLQPPLIFLDGVQLQDFSILANFRLDIVDYIEIDKSGFGQGIRGTNGVIRIVTDPQLRLNNSSYYNKFSASDFTVPLGFKKERKYYNPKYYSFNSKTFTDYGIVGWYPNITVSENGLVYLKVLDTKVDEVKMVIQGIDEEGKLIATEHIVPLSK